MAEAIGGRTYYGRYKCVEYSDTNGQTLKAHREQMYDRVLNMYDKYEEHKVILEFRIMGLEGLSHEEPLKKEFWDKLAKEQKELSDIKDEMRKMVEVYVEAHRRSHDGDPTSHSRVETILAWREKKATQQDNEGSAETKQHESSHTAETKQRNSQEENLGQPAPDFEDGQTNEGGTSTTTVFPTPDMTRTRRLSWP